jgi:hypothetical protein
MSRYQVQGFTKAVSGHSMIAIRLVNPEAPANIIEVLGTREGRIRLLQ